MKAPYSMDPKLIDHYKSAISDTHEFILSTVELEKQGKSISFGNRRILSEALLLYNELQTSKIVSSDAKFIILRTFRKGHDTLYRKILHFSDFYYTYHALRDNDLHKQQDQLKRANVEAATMNCHVQAYNQNLDGIGGSTDDYFFDRMSNVFSGTEKALNGNKEHVFIPILYLLINLKQVLIEYLNSEHATYNAKSEGLISTIDSLIARINETQTIQDYSSINKNLRYFYYSQFPEDYEKENREQLIEYIAQSRTENSLRLMQSLSKIDNELFPDLFEEAIEILLKRNEEWSTIENIIYCLLFNYYHRCKSINIEYELDLTDINRNFNLTDHLNKIFNQYDLITTVSLEDDEMDLLLNYNDQDLRDRVSKTFINVDPQVVERESKKPHGVFEISDMELQFKVADHRYYLCMPFKTGREISSPSVPVDVAHQILRPFLSFDNCAVVFITAKRCSQPLMNYFKQFRDKWRLDIQIIENEELAKFLKLNNQLN